MSSSSTTPAWPTALKVDPKKQVLSVSFDDGAVFDLEAELLRVNSPSAEVQGHSSDQRVTQTGKRNVKIRDMLPTGNYAIRIVFDDGHDTGIFTWAYLYQLGKEGPALWQAYLKELSDKGLTRG